MKKTIKANVSGMLFNLDEDAYQELEIYLDRLERHFSTNKGKKEIIEDIERGIADMMSSKLTESKTIITISDIQEIIKAMGEPGEIDDDNEPERARTETKTSGQRRLYRDGDNKMIAGICSGISQYLNIDIAWVRILFIVLLFISGTGLLIYLVLWIAVPEAVTTAQKLEMKGESINIDNIEKRVKEEFNNLGDQLNTFKDKHFNKKKSDLTQPVRDILSAFLRVFVVIAKMILIFFGIIFTLAAIVLVLMLIPAFITSSSDIFHVFNDFVYISIPNVIDAISISKSDYNMILASLLAVLLIPLLSIIIGGLGYLFNFRNEAKGINKALGILWFVGAILLAVSIFRTGDNFDNEETITSEMTIESKSQNQTLYLRLQPNALQSEPNFNEDLAKIYDDLDNDFLVFKSDSLFYSVPQLETYISEDSVFKINIVSKSYGNRKSDARISAQNIDYKPILNDSILEIPPLFSFPQQDKWRNQSLKIRVYIPKNREVKFIENEKIENDLYREIEREMKYSSN